jgi:hypothetical protein
MVLSMVFWGGRLACVGGSHVNYVSERWLYNQGFLPLCTKQCSSSVVV